MSNSELTHRTLKNVSYSMISYGWNFLFALFITPVIVFKLGVENYGIYIFVGVVASIVGLVDLGISSAISKYISEYIGAKKEKELKDLLYSANTLFLITGLIGFGVLLGIGELGSYFVSDEAILAYNIKPLLFVAGLTFLVNAINSIFHMIPVAAQRFDVSTKLGVASMTLTSLSVLAVVLLGYDLITIFIVQLTWAIIFSFLFYIYSRKILPIARLKFRWDKVEIFKSYRFALVAFISNVSGHALSYLDKMIIPVFINPTSLSYYSLAGSVASKTTGAIGSLTNIIFPMVSSLQGENNKETIKNVYIRSFRLITVFNAAMTSAICFFAYKIMQYWLDDIFALNSAKVLIVLALTYFLISLYNQLSNFLLGLGKTKILALFSVIMAIINIGLLFVLLPRWGIMGAAVAYLTSLLPAVYVFFYAEKKLFAMTGRLKYYIKFYAKIILTTIVFFPLAVFIIKPLITNFTTLIIMGPISVLSYLLIYRLFGFFEKEDLDTLSSFVKGVIGRKINRKFVN